MSVSGRIAEDAIRTVRERASLVEVVSDVVALKRRGDTRHRALPVPCREDAVVHRQRGARLLPLLRLRRGRRRLQFVMKTQRRRLSGGGAHGRASASAMPVPEERRARGRGASRWWRSTRRRRRSSAARCAARPARGAAATWPSEAFGPETIERFGLGYAPGGGDALVAPPADRRHAAGRRGRRRTGRCDATAGRVYDRFRDRVMFPIADRRGRVIAFGGRVLPGAVGSGDPPPKYLNSPESPIFHKGRTLYGLGLARDAIRQRGRVVVVEGYLDVDRAGAGGDRRGRGAARHGPHRRSARVARPLHARRVIACFDGDAAGRRAAARSFPVFIDAGLWGRGVFLPEGEDPDTFVRAHGGERFARAARDRRAADRSVAARGARSGSRRGRPACATPRARWRASCSACARAIPTSSTSSPVARRRPSASPRSGCAPRASRRRPPARRGADSGPRRGRGGDHRRAHRRASRRRGAGASCRTSSPSSSPGLARRRRAPAVGAVGRSRRRLERLPGRCAIGSRGGCSIRATRRARAGARRLRGRHPAAPVAPGTRPAGRRSARRGSARRRRRGRPGATAAARVLARRNPASEESPRAHTVPPRTSSPPSRIRAACADPGGCGRSTPGRDSTSPIDDAEPQDETRTRRRPTTSPSAPSARTADERFAGADPVRLYLTQMARGRC